MGLAVSVARRYSGRGETFDDLKQVAMIGLIKASRRYDPSRGTAFTTYAAATMDGELKRHFRQRWGLHVRRADQERYLVIRRANETLTHRLRRPPTIAELAEDTGFDAPKVRVAIGVGQTFSIEPLHQALVSASTRAIADLDDPFERFDVMASVRPLIAELTQQERDILGLRFGEDLRQTEIAQRLGMTQMQVSRILRRTLRKLRKRLSRS